MFPVMERGFKSLPLCQVLVGVDIPPPAIYGGMIDVYQAVARKINWLFTWMVTVSLSATDE
jgi:hypothetical protein